MPNGTEDQVGFLLPQSKHIWAISKGDLRWSCEWERYLVCRLGLELLKNLLGLSFRGRGHADSDYNNRY